MRCPSPASFQGVFIPKNDLTMNDIKQVCVYSASSTQIPQVYFETAQELGRLLAERGINLINGAGCIGLMAATSNAALAAGGTVTGVIPHFMVEQGWHHTGLTELVETQTMHERKRKMADLSDGVIALPGGCGTLEELLEIITWKQLGLYLNPIVVLNVNGFFDPLLAMLDRAVEEHFMRPQHRDIWKVATSPEEALNLLYTTPVWNKEIRKFAAI
ncbi:lysine decarboxylase [gut metagenome]|uniref:Lysine decarboxylase n=1 Tax=gut metagenome TaxID=749906 RepID=J9GPB4_9ZZZZ